MRSLFLIALAILPAASAFAECGFCASGHCTIHAPVVQKSVAVKATSHQGLFVLDHAPHIPYGTTQYYNQGNHSYEPLSVNRITSQAIELQKAADLSHERSTSATLKFLERVASIEAKKQQQIQRSAAIEKILKQAAALVDGPLAVDASEEWEFAEQLPAIAQTCAKCHVGADARGGFKLSGDFSIAKAIGAVSSGTMPPKDSGVEITADDRLKVVQEFLTLAEAEQ